MKAFCYTCRTEQEQTIDIDAGGVASICCTECECAREMEADELKSLPKCDACEAPTENNPVPTRHGFGFVRLCEECAS